MFKVNVPAGAAPRPTPATPGRAAAAPTAALTRAVTLARRRVVTSP
jgi:hypothetical protein